MYPFCIASAAMMMASVTSTGGVAAIVLNKLRAKNRAENLKQNEKERRTHHEHETSRASENRIAS
jgi:hypothetical protein